jgi:hypothetical protein
VDEGMNRKLTMTVIIVLLIGTLGGAVGIPKAKATTWNFHLWGNASLGWGLSPSQITKPGPLIQVYQGDTVNLNLTSDDTLPHQFFVDYNDNAIIDGSEPQSLQFSGSTSITYSFVADTLGNFTYRCAVHPTMMFGDFKVWTPIPEFPPFVFLPLFIALTILAVVILRRRH